MTSPSPTWATELATPPTYGLELLLDLKGCDPERMGRERIEEYFVLICEQIDMKRHGAPLFWEDFSGTPHLHGTSAIQFIETSNIVCHALPLLKAVYINIFSCKAFSAETATEISKAFWRASSAVHSIVVRT
jgi:S-adenosylmethionine/arginine decarboxylase-like enzyme